jgi:hypothetical protein
MEMVYRGIGILFDINPVTASKKDLKMSTQPFSHIYRAPQSDNENLKASAYTQKGPPRNLKHPFWVRGFILNTGYLSYLLLPACNLFGEPSCQFNFCNLSRQVRNDRIKIS